MQETSFMHEVLTIRFIVPDRQVTSIKTRNKLWRLSSKSPIKQTKSNKQTKPTKFVFYQRLKWEKKKNQSKKTKAIQIKYGFNHVEPLTNFHILVSNHYLKHIC